LDFQQLYLNLEYAPNGRFSLFTEIPVRWVDPQAFVTNSGTFSSHAGLGDIRTGFKVAPLASANRYLTFQFRAYAASGKSALGLGTSHTSIEPSLLYYQRISDRLAIESQIMSWHPIGGSEGVATPSNPNPEGFASDIFSYGIGPSYEVYRGESLRIAPVVELVGWHVFGGFQTVWASAARIADNVSGTNIVNMKVGVRTSIGGRNSFYVGYGRALTDVNWYEDIVRGEYRFSF
jgi:hypothetical protein